MRSSSQRCPAACRSEVKSRTGVYGSRDDLHEACNGLVQAVVDDPVLELAGGGQFLLGDSEAAGDRGRVVGAAPDEAVAQRVAVGRLDEDLNRLGHRLADLPGALDL